MCEKPIFIVGCRRSGTSLLRDLLSLHSRIGLLPAESHFLDYVLPRLDLVDIAAQRQEVVSILGQMNRWRAKDLRNTGMLKREYLDQAIYGRLTEFTPREILASVLQAHARLEGKDRWGDKTPDHVFHVRQLEDWFPHARVIQVMRHPCGVVCSHLYKGRSRGSPRSVWYYRSLPHIVQFWLRAARMAARHQDAYGESFCLLRFEDLVTDPVRVVWDLCDFVEEDFDEAMLTPPSVNSSFRKHTPAFGFDAAAVDRWQTALPGWTRGVVMSVCRPHMNRFGYT